VGFPFSIPVSALLAAEVEDSPFSSGLCFGFVAAEGIVNIALSDLDISMVLVWVM
jgi:hypothetical protein